ncbi:Izumo sperm-egg fusion protein 3, partial [Ophiophagus hannah]
MVLQVLLACFLWLLSFQGVASCLQCDPHFLKWVASLLKETLPGDLPNRDSLITRHIQALADLHGTFLRRNYERILGVTRRRMGRVEIRARLEDNISECLFADVRGVFNIKLHIINQLKTIKRKQWKGIFLWQFSMYQLRFALRKKIHQILEKFADLVEDKRLAEYNEIVLYVFLVCESVITTSIIL